MLAAVDPRHVAAVVVAFSVLFAPGCASTEQSAPPTTSAPASSTAGGSETGEPDSSTGEQPDDSVPDSVPSTAESASDETVPTTAESAPATVPEPGEGDYSTDTGGTSPQNVAVAEQPESAVAVLLGRLEALTVRPERRSGYDRDLFGHWVDADGDRCDARREVLIAEAVTRPRVGSPCTLSGGQWYSVYDGATETGTGSGFDVDHLVPLAEAWDSGAYDWDADTRRRFANDLGYEHSLVAVSASSNRQKGAADPAEWLPPDSSVRCWYAEAWIAVKTRWGLSVDSAELQALRALISQCDGRQLGSAPVAASPITAAAPTAPVSPSTSTVVAAADDADDLCHPAYIPCLPNLPGDAVNCGDLSSAQKPVQVLAIGVDPYRLDRDGDGWGCTS